MQGRVGWPMCPLSEKNRMNGKDGLSLFWAGDSPLEFGGSKPVSSILHTRLPRRDTAERPDEASLLRRLALDDTRAMMEITDQLQAPLVSYLYRLVDDRDVAMDIAQETLIRLWEGRRRTLPNSLAPYLYRVARNLAFNHLKARRTRLRLLKVRSAESGRRQATPEEELESASISRRVQRAIQLLPERRREVFVLGYLRGLTYAEIGEVMDISPKTVQNQMAAALAQLREALRPLLEEQPQSRTDHERGGR